MEADISHSSKGSKILDVSSILFAFLKFILKRCVVVMKNGKTRAFIAGLTFIASSGLLWRYSFMTLWQPLAWLTHLSYWKPVPSFLDPLYSLFSIAGVISVFHWPPFCPLSLCSWDAPIGTVLLVSSHLPMDFASSCREWALTWIQMVMIFILLQNTTRISTCSWMFPSEYSYTSYSVCLKCK